MYGSRRMFRVEFHLEQDASPGISMTVVNGKQFLQPLSTTASGTDPRAVMKIVRRPDRIITLFDGELDDFLALGIPMPHRIVITAGPRPDDLKAEVQRGGHCALSGLPISMGAQIDTVGSMDPISDKDVMPEQISNRASIMYERVIVLIGTKGSVRIDSGTDATLAASLCLLFRCGCEAAQLAVRALLEHDLWFQRYRVGDPMTRELVAMFAKRFNVATAMSEDGLSHPEDSSKIVVVATSLSKRSDLGEGILGIGGANFAANPFAASVLMSCGVDVILSHRSQSGPVSLLTPSLITREHLRAKFDVERQAWKNVEQLSISFFTSTDPVARRSAAFNVSALIKWAQKIVSGDRYFWRCDTLRTFLEELVAEDDQLHINQVLVGDLSMAALAASTEGTPLESLGPHLFARKPAKLGSDESGPLSMLHSIIAGFESIAAREAAVIGLSTFEPVPGPSPEKVTAALRDLITALDRRGNGSDLLSNGISRSTKKEFKEIKMGLAAAKESLKRMA